MISVLTSGGKSLKCARCRGVPANSLMETEFKNSSVLLWAITHDTPPPHRGKTPAQNWSFLVSRQRLWFFSVCDPLKWSCWKLLFFFFGSPFWDIFLNYKCNAPSPPQKHFSNILVTISKIEPSVRKNLFLRMRQIWLILKKTVIMRRNISWSSGCLLVASPVCHL